MTPDLRAVKLTLYVVIFLVSAVGNSLVCTVILRRKKMKTVTNYFILNLAIADLTLTCICIPFDIPVQEMDYQWPYGALLCRVIYPLQTLSLFASIYTLTAVSLSRYWAINHPLRQQLTIRCAKWIIFGIWIASLISVTPYISVLKKDSKTGKCDEDWPTKSSRKNVHRMPVRVRIPVSTDHNRWCVCEHWLGTCSTHKECKPLFTRSASRGSKESRAHAQSSDIAVSRCAFYPITSCGFG